MSQARSKVVPVDGMKFQVRRLPSEVGSYIFMRMMGASLRASAVSAEAASTSSLPAKQSSEPSEKPSGEMLVRALSFSVLSSAVGFDDFKFIQNACLRVVSIIDEEKSKATGADIPMPIMTDDGKWTPAAEDVQDNVGLTVKLTTEVLVFCFADFFDGGNPGL